MKKPQQIYNLKIPNDDYKIAAVMERDKANFESANIWLYVGTDGMKPEFAKVGITMGDLGSRSYCTGNPDYYLFCAFQCNIHTTKSKLESIEAGALNHLDSLFPKHRVPHRESGTLSECYRGIDFETFLISLNDYLLDKHHNDFQTVEYENAIGIVEGYALVCEFNNSILPRDEISRFQRLFIRYY
ncbi:MULTISPECIES: hypothetical protein [Shewanella]|uniref:hypothetical protein n=1 Tax=Shewanella TaxID=22 RepID=UPI000F4238D8|nr:MULTISPECIES: hypothetical protein [Shewanella]AYV11532.1 hypothetical protein EEY24_00760 [Shewanella algae]